MPTQKWESWPSYKFGLEMSEIGTTLFEKFNTVPMQLNANNLFYMDVYNAAEKASTKEELYTILERRKGQRIQMFREHILLMAKDSQNDRYAESCYLPDMYESLSKEPCLALVVALLRTCNTPGDFYPFLLDNEDREALKEKQTRLTPRSMSPISPDTSFQINFHGNTAATAISLTAIEEQSLNTVVQPEDAGPAERVDNEGETCSEEGYPLDTTIRAFENAVIEKEANALVKVAATQNDEIWPEDYSQPESFDYDSDFTNRVSQEKDYPVLTWDDDYDESMDWENKAPYDGESGPWWDTTRSSSAPTDDSVSIPDTASVSAAPCSVVVHDDDMADITESDVPAGEADATSHSRKTSSVGSDTAISESDLRDALSSIRGSPKDQSRSSRISVAKKTFSGDISTPARSTSSGIKKNKRAHKMS